jgi:hypothetical protein
MTRTERLRAREALFSLNSNTTAIDGNQERVERRRREERREVVYFFQYTRHGKKVRHQREATHKEHECSSLLVGCQDLGALNALRHPLGSTRCGCHHENLRNATIKDGTNIQGLEHEEQKTEQKRDSPSVDPLTIATIGIKVRGSIHTLLDQWGLRTKEEWKEEWNMHPFIQLVMEWAKVGSKEA